MLNIWGFPKTRGTILGVPIIRTIVFCVYIGVPILGNDHLGRVAIEKYSHGQGLGAGGTRGRTCACAALKRGLRSKHFSELKPGPQSTTTSESSK